jgi:nicotinate-nucleotide adenylyltransferase
MAVKTGLLGGSFDPIHLAHIALADTAMQALGLAGVELIPAAQPWQRRPLAASSEHRLAMLELAVQGHPGLHANPMEIRRGGQTYTIDTLRNLPSGVDYYWILGADQLDNFCSWRDWQEITERVQLVVAQRPGATLNPPALLKQRLDGLNRRLVTLPFQPVAISSTLIRQRIARGEPTDGLLNVAVAHYIEKNGLYQAPVA